VGSLLTLGVSISTGLSDVNKTLVGGFELSLSTVDVILNAVELNCEVGEVGVGLVEGDLDHVSGLLEGFNALILCESLKIDGV